LIGVFACFVGEVSLGIGKHWDDPSLFYNFTDLMRWNWAHALLVVAGISSVKISVGLFLMRVVEGTKYKRFIIAMIGTTTMTRNVTDPEVDKLTILQFSSSFSPLLV
jgi:hypothetical protein